MCSKSFFCKFSQQSLRHISTSKGYYSRSHYDSLEITPKASQKEVKDAYYKLSKLYHPDKNQGCENASKKFRQVSEAYEVLGNVKLRKLYDRGAFNIGRQTEDIQKEHPSERYRRFREKRARPAAPSGGAPVYDFDEWSRQHYGATFARDMEIRRIIYKQRMYKQKQDNEIKVERILISLGVLFICTTIMSYGLQDYDRVNDQTSRETLDDND